MKIKGWKTFLILDFLKTLVTQNHNSAFNKGFNLRQAVNSSLSLFENKIWSEMYICKRFSRAIKVSEYPQKLKILKVAFSWFTVFLFD